MAKKAKDDARPDKMLGKEDFQNLKRRYENLQTASSENSADRKQLLEDFKAKGLDPEAFKIILTLDKLNDGKRDTRLANFDLYRSFMPWGAQDDMLVKSGADKENRDKIGKVAAAEANKEPTHAGAA